MRANYKKIQLSGISGQLPQKIIERQWHFSFQAPYAQEELFSFGTHSGLFNKWENQLILFGPKGAEYLKIA